MKHRKISNVRGARYGTIGGARQVSKMNAVRTKQEEVVRNFESFQKELPQLLPTHTGKFALIRDCKITGFYDTAIDAHTAGNQLYPDGLFSIQAISGDIADLGFYSHAMYLGAA